MSKIWLCLAHMGGKEQEFVQQAFDTNWVVPLGPNVDGFEKDLEGWHGRRADHPIHVVALASERWCHRSDDGEGGAAAL
jgi:dTDP-4-amino-4,6-dideoxygalactose transaminase